MDLELTPAQRARRDLLLELRAGNYARLGGAVAAEIAARPDLAASASSADLDARYRAYLADSKLATLWSNVQRLGQEMMWQWAEGVVEAHADRLQDGPAAGPGLLETDDRLPMPRYFDQVDFHIQPGGYQGPLAGFVYDTMVPLFYMGRMPVDHYASVLSSECPVERPRRILDLGAGVGHSTLQWAARFPDADVHAIDLSASVLQCLLWNARERGLAVHCRQMNAEALAYDSASFDVVNALILMHELPPDAIRRVAREARRVLKPGGGFIVADHVSLGPATTPFQKFHRWWDTHFNGEPYVFDFVQLDLVGLLKEEGFVGIEEHAIGKPSGHAGSSVARAVIARV